MYVVQEFDKDSFEQSGELPEEVRAYFEKRSKFAISEVVLDGLSGLEWLNPYTKSATKISEWRTRFIKPQKTPMEYRIEPVAYFGKNMEVFLKKIKDSVDDGFQVVLFLPKKGFSQRITGLLKGSSKVTVLENWVDLLGTKSRVLMLEETLSSGFECTDCKLLVLTYSDFTGTAYREDERSNSSANFSGDVLHHFSELVQGDFVIHQDYGVAQFKGIETITMDSIQKEYLVLQYAGTDRVLVPITEVDRIHRHTPVRDGAPVLNKLNSVRWNQVKNKVKESVEQYARELLEHYAKREVSAGYQFSADNEAVKNLEEGFEYDETKDQLRAVAEIKRDMQRAEPMDRLLCGDVGYGKTEVAIRAAFKALQDQKQVAVLCPTTILAQQHFQTFSSRLLGSGARVEVLNRFVEPKRQKEIIQSLKLGEVDIVIGTHRILSADVQFQDLGLLVVDEEQRFGVSHKEKLRQLRRGVDTLMMSATPIPRTLHMSLGGARAISVIQTPPTGRLPVKTFVLPWQEVTIKEAIEREIRRNGQVFYVYNRVETIASKANQLLRMIPNLRLRWLHGQMEADEIEDVMTAFMRREFDVLLATTIIESGMDIPNVNTILVDEADNFGLAQLYQLRGRIGRRDIQGYAYLFYRQESSLTEVAKKRLFALEEFTDLGAGFKIAMRDMEIRGAGNLLGKSQSGHVHSIGFDLYSRLLRDAIERLQDENFQEELDMPQVELKVNAFLNDKYIPSYRERMDFFRRLSWLRNLEALEELQRECFDRYGALPTEMRQLFKVITLRIQAHWYNIRRFSQLNNQVTIDFHKALNPDLLDLAKRKFMRMVDSSSNFPERMVIRFPVMDSDKLLDQLIGFFSRENHEKLFSNVKTA
ncbi:MAG: transcription-repair coupling factor [Candidatus Cloacimonetes bacterium]|nr:transcription-repair coupling factor [Candidatus Cloacimonadota bacterium]